MVINALSNERLTPYLVETGHHEQAALALYAWNLRLSESFYPLLSTTEIVLRNVVSARIRQIYGDEWWERDEFHTTIGRKAKGIVLRARNKRQDEKGRVSHGCMVAELTFGFWTNMLLAKYEEHFWSPLSSAFPDVPSGTTYDDLSRKCDRVSALRNRIFHHEPMFKRNITEDYRATLELLSWLNPKAAIWIRPQLRTMAVLRERPRHRT
ncbi:MAG: hypothetical protein R3D60_01150 [Paracoccaceae bacterium]